MALVGIATVLWTIWKARNAACFDGEKLNDTYTLIRMIIHWIDLWAILQLKQDSREEMMWGGKVSRAGGK